SPGFGVELISGVLKKIDEEILDTLHIHAYSGQVSQDRPLDDIAPQTPADLGEIVLQHVLREASQGQIALVEIGDGLRLFLGSVEPDELPEGEPLDVDLVPPPQARLAGSVPEKPASGAGRHDPAGAGVDGLLQPEVPFRG